MRRSSPTRHIVRSSSLVVARPRCCSRWACAGASGRPAPPRPLTRPTGCSLASTTSAAPADHHGGHLDDHHAATTRPPAADSGQGGARAMTLRQKAAQVLLLEFSGTDDRLPRAARVLGRHSSGRAHAPRQEREGRGATDARSTPRCRRRPRTAWRRRYGCSSPPTRRADRCSGCEDGVPDVPAARDAGEALDAGEGRGPWPPRPPRALLAQGVNMDLAPVADVVKKPDFLYSRTYSGDPGRVADFVTRRHQRLQQGGADHRDQALSRAWQRPGEHPHVEPSSPRATRAGVRDHPPGAVRGRHRRGSGGRHDGPHRGQRVRSEAPRVLLDQGHRETAAGAAGVHGGRGDRTRWRWPRARTESGAGRAPATAQEVADTAVACLNAGCDLLISTGTLSTPVGDRGHDRRGGEERQAAASPPQRGGDADPASSKRGTGW